MIALFSQIANMSRRIAIKTPELPAKIVGRTKPAVQSDLLDRAKSLFVENWLFAPQSFDLKKEARDYVAILLEMYLLCPTLRNPATNE